MALLQALPEDEAGAEPSSALADVTLLLEGAEGAGLGEEAAEPVLALVSLNPRTAASFDLVRGADTVLPRLQDASVASRTWRVSCGRDPVNTLVLADPRASLVHFTLRVLETRAGLVTLDLLDESSNGTYVNGRRVGRGRSVPVAEGDQILVLPASQVGRHAEVGFVLLRDAKGAHCCGVGGGTRWQLQAAAAGVCACASGGGAVAEAGARSLPPSPRGVTVPRALERDLRCGICADALYHCLTLVPCGHNFCTACFVRWRRRSYACPECREHVQQAARSPRGIMAMEAAEKDPSNGAMLRWLLRKTLAPHDPRSAASPQRHQEREQQQQQQRPQSLMAASTACAIS